MGSSTVERAIIISLFGLITYGCASNKLVGRYASAKCQTEGSQPTSCTSIQPGASAYVASIKTPQPSSDASGTSLPERALAAYINVIGNQKISATAKDLRSNLSAKLSGPSSSSGDVADRTVFSKTLIVTVRKEGRFNPADRLEATNVKIKLDNARFESWDTLATAYTTVNAGTVQLTQTRGLTESLTAGAPSTAPASVSATVTGNQSNTKVENYTATNQTETLTATIEDEGRALVIYRQGGAGIDLTGNTVIKVTISYIGSSPMFTHVFFVDKYKDKKMKWLSPNKLSVADKPVLAVPPGNAIPAQIILIYTLRHVESGDSTYEERDDKVIEFTASVVSH
jgi:hypothetical protein